MIWHLYDYYLRPAGGYFGAKRALEPLHPVYGYDDHSVWVVSSQYEDAKGLKLITKVYNLDMTEKFSQEFIAGRGRRQHSQSADASRPRRCECGLLRVLRLEDGTGKLVGSNFYWLSSKPETLDWEKSNWYMTPTASFADYSAAQPAAEGEVESGQPVGAERRPDADPRDARKSSKSLAFFVASQGEQGSGR